MEKLRTLGEVHWTVFALLASAVLIFVGVQWDISWHRTIGRDTFWTPAHLAIQGGGVLAGVCCVWAALRSSGHMSGLQGVRIFGIVAPLGAWIAVWGTLAMLTSAPLDDWWHGAYGLDVTILSPPHILLAAGIVAIQAGACLVALSWQNRATGSARKFMGLYYTIAAGVLIATVAIVIMERTLSNQQHSAQFYLISAGTFPVILFAIARSGTLRFAATAATGAYMGLNLIMIWILPLFPGEPMLAPILREITHFVPPEFPLLLVVPAFAVDLLDRHLRRRDGKRNDWLVAGIGAMSFVAILLAVQWPFSEFLLSDESRNYFFQGHQHGYSQLPGPWETEFWYGPGGFSASAFWGGIGLAILLAFASARIGLFTGNWMRRLHR